jgi:hypothetical protein
MSLRNALLLLTITFACGCSTYRPPPTPEHADNAVDLNEPFDRVWSNLIDCVSGTYFGIETHERASGLITLSFGLANPSQFVTGGYFKSGRVNFEGDYVDYLTQLWSGRLTGKMNIVAKDLGNSRTRLTVNAVYTFSAVFPDGTDTWSFDSRQCATNRVTNPSAGTSATRTICPTGKAEKDIIKCTAGLS